MLSSSTPSSCQFCYEGLGLSVWSLQVLPRCASVKTVHSVTAMALKPHWKRWYIRLKLQDLDHRVPGEIKRSRDLRGGRWSWTLTFAQKRSWVGRWSWAEQVGRLLLRVVQVVRQQPCNGHCLSDSVQHSSWKSNCAVHKSLGNGEGTPP